LRLTVSHCKRYFNFADRNSAIRPTFRGIHSTNTSVPSSFSKSSTPSPLATGDKKKMPNYRASIHNVTGEILCIDGTRQVSDL